MSDSEREEWIKRVIRDFNDVTGAFDNYMKGINPNWSIIKCKIGGSLGRYIEDEKRMFKTPYGGISGTEERKDVPPEFIPPEYVSDIDAVCWVTPETDIWHHGNLWMGFEGKIFNNPDMFPKSRKGKCINYRGDEIESKYCNAADEIPLDEPDLRRTHDIVLHLRKPGQPSIFGLELEDQE